MLAQLTVYLCNRQIIVSQKRITFLCSQLLRINLMRLYPLQDPQHKLLLSLIKIRIRRIVFLSVITNLFQKSLPALS